MVTNKSLFAPQNILLDSKTYLSDQKKRQHYGDIDSGIWLTVAKGKERTQLTHISIPFYHFIDDLTVDKYVKLTVEDGFT